MRKALAQSIARTDPMELYPRGGIVVCVSCAAPIYRLERSVSIGEKAGRAVSAFRPVTVADLNDLADRPDVDAGVRAMVRVMDAPTRRQYADTIAAPRAGDPAICPKCHEAMIAGRTAEVSDTQDRAYVFELHVINPRGHAQAIMRRAR